MDNESRGKKGDKTVIEGNRVNRKRKNNEKENREIKIGTLNVRSLKKTGESQNQKKHS